MNEFPETNRIMAIAEDAKKTYESGYQASRALVISQRNSMIKPDEWASLKDQAKVFHASGCLPSTIKKPEEAMVLIVKGRELGIPAMTSLSSIHMIKGVPTLSAQLMKALVLRDYPGSRFETVKSTEEEAEVAIHIPGRPPAVHGFTIHEARRSGLLGKDNWKNYPKDMLLHRAVSRCCRHEAPDVILGCYTRDEAEEIVAQERMISEPPRILPKYMPGIEPRSTLDQYVENLSGVPGSEQVFANQLAAYASSMATVEWVEQLTTALTAAGYEVVHEGTMYVVARKSDPMNACQAPAEQFEKLPFEEEKNG